MFADALRRSCRGVLHSVLFVLGTVVLGAIWLLFNLLVIAPLYVAALIKDEIRELSRRAGGA